MPGPITAEVTQVLQAEGSTLMEPASGTAVFIALYVQFGSPLFESHCMIPQTTLKRQNSLHQA